MPEPKKTDELEMHAVETRIVELTNYERARRGLPRLVIDRALMRSARRHCAWMTNSRRMQHTGAAVAENIAMGQGSADEAVRDWMNSSGHRANILSGNYRRIGVSAYSTPGGTVYWCQQFLD
jgi:uncharacterized protein YkwD